MATDKRAYDSRVREIIARTGNADLFPELDNPRGTRDAWVRRGPRDVVGLEAEIADSARLLDRVSRLERRLRILAALVLLLRAVLRVSAFQLDLERLPAGKHKLALLNAIEKSRKTLPLTAVLKVLRLSGSRYHAWARAAEVCSLDDRPSCPRSIPQRLTIDEIRAIKHMVLSRAHRHMSIRALALHAQRIGEVFAHPGTWSKLIRERGWGRPRAREYPAKPTRGIRATTPNEAWHVDTTIIRLLDGTKAYLHAVINNYSRKILARKLADTRDRTARSPPCSARPSGSTGHARTSSWTRVRRT